MAGRCPLPPLSENVSVISPAAQYFGTDASCNDPNGPTAFVPLWDLVADNIYNSSGCNAVAAPLSLVSQATSVALCQIVESALVYQTQPVTEYRIIPTSKSIITCPDQFSPNNIGTLNLQCSASLDPEAQQSIADILNGMIYNLITSKASRNSGVSSTALLQAAIDAAKDYITPEMVNETYQTILTPSESQSGALVLTLTVQGTLAGLPCTLPVKEAFQLMIAQQVVHVVANKAASLGAVVEFNNQFPNNSGASGTTVGLAVGITLAVIVVICIIAFMIKSKRS